MITTGHDALELAAAIFGQTVDGPCKPGGGRQDHQPLRSTETGFENL